MPGFKWSAWWTNAVLMGVQVGDAFGEPFAEAAELMAAEGWRMRVMNALVAEGLPAAWLPTAVQLARGHELADGSKRRARGPGGLRGAVQARGSRGRARHVNVIAGAFC